LPPHFLAVICALVRISVLLFWLKEQSNERRVDQVTFDEAAREPIRKKLIQHMKKVRIGVPTLAKQIMAQNPGNEIKIAMRHRFPNGRTRNRSSCGAVPQLRRKPGGWDPELI
jgi:hypothetical protein